MIHLILGGARSGKSSFAETWCLEHQKRAGNIEHKGLFYLATATFSDAEMLSRIEKHQQQRAKHWRLIECPLALGDELLLARESLSNMPHKTVPLYLIDCLTLWLNNVLFELGDDANSDRIQKSVDSFMNVIAQFSSAQASDIDIVLVANEVGLGVIPMGEVSRLFVDHAGWLNQRLAQLADKVTFIAAGLPMQLKPTLSLMSEQLIDNAAE